MKPSQAKIVVFNVAAAMVGLTAVGFAVRSMLPTSVAPCSERYNAVMTFALEQGQQPLTAAELQQRLQGRDVGVVENVEIAKPNASAPVAMAVALRKEPIPGAAGAALGNGMSFTWEPRALQNKTSACLSYNVLLPAGLDMSVGGVLPGISSVERRNQGEHGLVARPVWRESGKGGAELARHTAADGVRSLPLDWTGYALPLGQWVKVEQELVLNAPKSADGVYRLWVDGSLAVERTDLELATDQAISLSGAAATVSYGNGSAPVKVPQEAKIWMSPLQLRWQQ